MGNMSGDILEEWNVHSTKNALIFSKVDASFMSPKKIQTQAYLKRKTIFQNSKTLRILEISYSNLHRMDSTKCLSCTETSSISAKPFIQKHPHTRWLCAGWSHKAVRTCNSSFKISAIYIDVDVSRTWGCKFCRKC